MFESLTDRMSDALRTLRGISKLTENNIEDALKEVRSALLSADVHFKVAKEFIERVKVASLGQDVLKSISPGQLIIKIIHDELVKILGAGKTDLSDKRPLKIMMVGLHGSGKTTTTVKLALSLKKKGYKPALIACDVYRPAAIDQLELLAKQEDILVYTDRDSKDVPKIGKKGLEWANEAGCDAIIFDTAGRLQIDENLIKEIQELSKKVEPEETLLVADSALGQEAVNVAKHFHDAVNVTGIVLTKLDGDARGGAALSMKSIADVPIKFMGIGEKLTDFDLFYPERMAQRILGMGDVVSLVEKAQENYSEEEAEKLAKKIKKAEFDLDDMLSQLKQFKKMGSIASVASMLPGMGKMNLGTKEENQIKHMEALIQSMTLQERQNPKIINGSRRMRIAKGAGLEVKDLNQFLKQFLMMKKMMKSMKGSKGLKLQKKMAASMGGSSNPFANMPL